MAKENQEKPTPKQYAEKVVIDMDFHQAMKLLAQHANAKGTKKITYQSRSRVMVQE